MLTLLCCFSISVDYSSPRRGKTLVSHMTSCVFFFKCAYTIVSYFACRATRSAQKYYICASTNVTFRDDCASDSALLLTQFNAWNKVIYIKVCLILINKEFDFREARTHYFSEDYEARIERIMQYLFRKIVTFSIL